MNKRLFFILSLVPLGLSFAACDDFDADKPKFDNMVYLDVSQKSEIQMATISNRLPETDKPIYATLTHPASSDVTVTVSVDPSLVEDYNTRYGTSWQALESKYYELQNPDVTIPTGKNVSEQAVTLHLKGLTGEGEEQAGALAIDETYLVPVRIAASSMSVLKGSDVAYFVVKRSSNITVAARLIDSWIEFPTLDKTGPQSAAWNGLTAVTYEALIYIDKFDDTNDFGACNISSVMGVEQYLLLRLGDTNFERQQLQFDGSGSGSAFGKIPESDASKNLQTGRWYHVACTYDQNTQTVRVYLDGKIQSEATGVGITTPGDDNKINLAMRGLYEETDDKYMKDAYQFFIAKSYNDYRPLQGMIAEARVWSVARTPEQIWENMYEIKDPGQDPTLIGYWKFDEGEGNTIHDYSQYGNDGVAMRHGEEAALPADIEWPAGVEIEKINQTED